MKKVIGLFIILSLFLIACSTTQKISQKETTQTQEEVIGTLAGKKTIKITAEGTKFLVDPKKIVGGGPPKDGIPSIDNPKFVTVEEANNWIQDNELVLAIQYKGIKRVYPLQIMVWH